MARIVNNSKNMIKSFIYHDYFGIIYVSSKNPLFWRQAPAQKGRHENL